ncbi:MAG: hypothetical protein Ta2E_06090 [Mycoplasmoidaceae bacterium]|nr:MAG: hypothetical protein Ta2E_06090 [Mycoplasmoidaceae bacterium]
MDNVENAIQVKKTKFSKRAIIIVFVCIFFLLLSLFRVPYCGSYIDSFLFDFSFGTYKYIIYATIISLLLLFCFDRIKYRAIMKFRYIIGYIILSFALSNMITSIEKIIHIREGAHNFVWYINTYSSNFMNYVDNGNTYSGFFNENFSGGFFSDFIFAVVSQGIAFIFLLASILISIGAVGILFNKKIKLNKFSKNKKEDINFNLINKDAEKGVMNLPSYDYLNDTSVNNDEKNMAIMDTYSEKIATVLKTNDIHYSKKDINVMPIYSQIIFDLDTEELADTVLSIQDKFVSLFRNEKLAILAKGNIVTFEFMNKEPSKLGFKQIIKRTSKNCLPIGIDLEKKVVMSKMDSHNNMFVVGAIGGGTSMIINTIIAGFAYTNDPSTSEIIICECDDSNNNMLKTFHDLLHIVDKDTIGLSKCIDAINKAINSTKKILIILNDFDKLVKISYTNREKVIELLKVAKASKKIHVILTTKNVTNDSAGNDILSLVDEKFLFKTETEAESKALLDSPRAYQLCGMGDAFYLDKNQDKVRIQTCFISKNEAATIVKLVNTFFSKLNTNK